MSQENVDTLRAGMEALNRRDFDAGIRYLHPEVEVRPVITGPDLPAVYRGRDEVRGFWETVTDAWDSLTIEPSELIAGPAGVFAVGDWRVTGRDGIELDFKTIDVYAFRDGLIFRVDGFTDRDKALAAAGLSE